MMNLGNSLKTLVVIAALAGCQAKTDTVSDAKLIPGDLYDNIEFDMPQVAEPEIPDRSVNITEFGAIGDGKTKNTKAFEEAIATTVEQGGGRIVVPRGIWLTGPIRLQNRINLHLEEGALIRFSDEFDDYPLVETSFEGLKTFRCVSPISGNDLESIAITGKGVIDGSGGAWRPVKKFKMTDRQWKELVKSGGVLNAKGDIWWPSEKALRGSQMSDMNVPDKLQTKEDHEAIKDFLRPVMVSLVNCKKILLDGPTFQNSPAWNIHPLMCEDITIRNITVRNPWYSQNGDGLDLESCKNAVIYNSRFDVGDDAICIKSGKNEQGRKRGMPTENVIVKNCVVYHGHGGFVVGSEMSGGVRNIHVSNCTFIGTDVGLRFKSTRGRGGVVENIYISNIHMTDIPTEPIRFNLYYGGNSPIPEPGSEDLAAQSEVEIPAVTEETPQFRNIYMKNIICRGAGKAIYMQGLPEMNIDNIYLEQVDITADKGAECIDARNIHFVDVNIEAKEGPALHLYNAKDFMAKNFTAQYPEDARAVVVSGALSSNVTFENSELDENRLTLGKGVQEDEITVKN